MAQSPPTHDKLARRDFLRLLGAAGSTLIGAMAGCGGGASGLLSQPSLSTDLRSHIEKIVVVMMENRSFDHLLGWLPGADGRQAHLRYPNREKQEFSTWRLQGIYRGCDLGDPNHTYQGGRQEYNDGLMNGFLMADGNTKFAIGYYTEQDIPFQSALARHFTSCDRYFASILGPTTPNRLFLHSAQTDRLTDASSEVILPTIWDRLAQAKISARYYFSNYSYLSLWGDKYNSISFSTNQFFADAMAGALPAVSFVEPSFSLPSNDNDGEDQHPNADFRRGELFLWKVYQALTKGPAWNETVLVITYDEWGGFFDHVPPPRATAPNLVDPDLVDGKALLGLRVPVVVVSPFSKGAPQIPTVCREVFDHTSILKLIEWRWGLEPLTARDASQDIGNLAAALDLSMNPVPAPELPEPAATPVVSCATQPTL
jgi:phospholipase C